MTERRCLLTGLLLMATLAAATAADNAFVDLPPEVQRVLADQRELWPELDDAARSRLRRGAERWLSLAPDERRAARQRWQHWRQLDADERQALRKRMARFRALPQAKRERLRATLQRFRQLPEAERRSLRQQWQALPPDQRRARRQQMMQQAFDRDVERRGRFRVEERQRIRRAIDGLDEPARRALRERLRGADPIERREILLEFSRAHAPSTDDDSDADE